MPKIDIWLAWRPITHTLILFHHSLLNPVSATIRESGHGMAIHASCISLTPNWLRQILSGNWSCGYNSFHGEYLCTAFSLALFSRQLSQECVCLCCTLIWKATIDGSSCNAEIRLCEFYFGGLFPPSLKSGLCEEAEDAAQVSCLSKTCEK